jgi:hypothetical protein
MRITHPRRARTAVVLATAGALGGLSLVTASSATAAPAGVFTDLGASGASVSFSSYASDSLDNCTLTSPGTGLPLALAADGQPHSVTVAQSTVATLDSAPGSDITSGSGTTTLTSTISQADGQLSHASLTSTYTASLANADATPGSGCVSSVSTTGVAEFAFDLVRPTYVTVTASAKGMIAIGAVVSDPTALSLSLSGSLSDLSLAAAIGGGKHGTGTGTALLPAGQFYVGINAALGSRGGVGSSTGSSQVDISFDTPGMAKGAATGKGGKYAALPDADNCATNTAAVTWTKKAGKKKHSTIKKATFKVDGVKVGSAKKPTKGKTTQLKNLPAEKAFTIEGTIKLASGKTVTVSRDYQACS